MALCKAGTTGRRSATHICAPLALLELEAALDARYGISGQGELAWTLGMGFSRDVEANMVYLSQKLYIETLVRGFGLDENYRYAPDTWYCDHSRRMPDKQ